MKTLIIYSTKYGTSKKCAEMIKDKLSKDTVLVNISNSKNVELSAYDTVVVGSSIRMGKIDKKIKNFCEVNVDKLAQKRLGLFICSGFEENANKDFNSNFDKKLIKNCIVKSWLGGEINIKKARGVDKLIISMVVKMFEQDGHKEYPKINEENIEEFSKIINKI